MNADSIQQAGETSTVSSRQLYETFSFGWQGESGKKRERKANRTSDEWVLDIMHDCNAVMYPHVMMSVDHQHTVTYDSRASPRIPRR